MKTLLIITLCLGLAATVQAQKWSALDAGTTTDSGDLFQFVDVSDTTMAATGTNKKITWAQVIAEVIADTAATYQPLDSDLTTWAGVTPSANGQTLVAADYATMRSLLNLEVGTDFPGLGSNNSFTGANVFDSAPRTPFIALPSSPASLSAGGRYTGAISGAYTLTLPSSPDTGDSVSVAATVTNAPTVTFSESVIRVGGAAGTTLALTNSTHLMSLIYDGTNWLLIDSVEADAATGVSTADIDTFAELNAIVADQTLIHSGDIADFVPSDPTGVTGADAVTNIMSLTQAEYDAIGAPNASTLYVITD